MLYDVTRRYPRAYIHRHKLHTRPVGFNAEGPAEMHNLLNQIDDLIEGRYHARTAGTDDEAMYATTMIPNPSGIGEQEYIRRCIYLKPPHLTADNHFSGEHVMDYAGVRGYGLTVTNCRDRFPKSLKPYLHHEKVKPGDARSKAMRYQNPIVVVKQVPATATTKAYTKNIVSFQSTGATNIAGVNNLPSAQLYVTSRERGRVKQK